jgi:serine/threonine protein kinase
VRWDLRPDSILLDREGRAVISISDEKTYKDFNSTKTLPDGLDYKEKSKWISPELTKAQKKLEKIGLEKSNIFSLGLLALFCLDSNEFIKQKNLNTDEIALESYINKFRLKIQNKRFYYLLRCMLSFSPSTRPSVKEIIEDLAELFHPLNLDKTQFGFQTTNNPSLIKVKIFKKSFSPRNFSINFYI